MTLRSIFALSAVLFAGTALAGDTRTATTTELSEGAEIVVPEDCTLDRTSDTEFALSCFDDGGDEPSSLYIVTCGDGTTFTYLGGAPGNGCQSAEGHNDCRAHRGCVSVL